MPDPVFATSDGSVLVEHFYRQLAVDRVARAREALSAEPVEQALSQSAQAFERAAAAVEHALAVAPAAGELTARLAEQAEALVLIAARFEQSADLARHVASAQRPSSLKPRATTNNRNLGAAAMPAAPVKERKEARMTEPTHTILLAEDDPQSRSFLSEQLAFDGYEVIEADSRAKALAILATRQPDLLLADVNGETLSLIDAVREADGLASRIDSGTPMLVLTARAEELARVRYLDRGSDDVLAKPYSYTELRARVRALLRRTNRIAVGRVVRIGALRIDLAAREAWIDDTSVELTAKEYELLRCLASEPTRVFTRQELLRGVWGYPSASRSRTVDSHAARLRQKLYRPGGQRLIVNVWGIGWRLIDPPGLGAAQ